MYKTVQNQYLKKPKSTAVQYNRMVDSLKLGEGGGRGKRQRAYFGNVVDSILKEN